MSRQSASKRASRTRNLEVDAAGLVRGAGLARPAPSTAPIAIVATTAPSFGSSGRGGKAASGATCALPLWLGAPTAGAVESAGEATALVAAAGSGRLPAGGLTLMPGRPPLRLPRPAGTRQGN